MLYVTLPSTQQYSWTEEQENVFKRDFPFENLDRAKYTYIPVWMKGTTFSGHPTATTLGNTLRSICYVRYYLHKAQIPISLVRYFVAGDDVNILCPAGLALKL